MAAGSVKLPGTYTIKDLVKDVNGSTGYSEDKAALGTILDEFKLKLPYGIKLSPDFNSKINPLSSDGFIEDFLSLNYNALTSGSKAISTSSAAFITMLRALIVRGGYICSEMKHRAVHIDEYDYTEEGAAKMANIDLSPVLVKFLSDYWETICCVVLHVFQVRGHHWKPEYNKVYDRAWNATTIEVPVGMVMPSWQEISTIGLHPFGIRALYLIREDSLATSKLPRGLMLRRDAAYAGTAPIRTSAAALQEMAAARWWKAFYAKFKEEIDALLKDAEELKALGPAGHINARLFNPTLVPQKIDESKVTRLSPYILAWLDTLDADEAIRQQKTLNKRAQGGSSIRNSFASVLMSELKNDKSALSVAAYLSTV